MSIDAPEERLYERVERTIQAARSSVARSVNLAMVHAYWLIGRDIVEVEQAGDKRAGYGDRLMDRLSTRLTVRFGRGFGARTLRRLRRFYLTWPNGSTLFESGRSGKNARLLNVSSALEIWTEALSKSERHQIWTGPLSKFDATRQALFPPALSWTHYLELMKVKNNDARAFYELEAAQEIGQPNSSLAKSAPCCTSASPEVAMKRGFGRWHARASKSQALQASSRIR